MAKNHMSYNWARKSISGRVEINPDRNGPFYDTERPSNLDVEKGRQIYSEINVSSFH